jgi:Ca-activated chloride channel family protein
MSLTLKSKMKISSLIVLSIVILLLAACSAPAEQLNQEGNQAFAEQAYLEALELYQSAQIESPELAEPYFNAANTHYRQGDYPAALEQMQTALQYVDEETLAESSFYNLGNSYFNSQELNTAAEAYKQALLLDPADQDAKYNLELALQQQEQQQNEDQEQQEQNSESNNESNSDSQDQQGEEGNPEKSENQESQNGENQDESEQGQNGDQSENNDQQEGDQKNNAESSRQGENPQESEQPSQTPAPGQRMTEEQAKQLLAAIANDAQTLQERLGQYLFARQAPPAQDW